ncbi:MAG: type VI secretion system contractile sheath large subunit [Alphaproteobacteria bacterium]|nr:type VI secretion system contractile sheath large subunit [Alphaproteobacteria bacterium]
MSSVQNERQGAGGTSTVLLEEVAELTTDLVDASGLDPDDAPDLPNVLSQLLDEVITTSEGVGEKPKFSLELINGMMAEIDRKLSAQVDEILHDPAFKEVESAWRGLRFLVDRTDFDQNIRIEMLDVSKQELADDIEQRPTLRATRLCQVAYESKLGSYGNDPVGVIIGNYDFGPTAPDMQLLEDISRVAAQAHAPFIAAASPRFFNIKSFTGLPTRPKVDTKHHKRWQSFRQSDFANYVGLTLPRFLLRHPYDPEENPVRSFEYAEDVSGSHDEYLWGNAAFAFGSCLTDSFAKYRWCPNIVGPEGGGRIRNLPVHEYEAMGRAVVKPPTEVSLSMPREDELSEQGFIPMIYENNSVNAVFFGANSTQRPKTFGNNPEDKKREGNFLLGTRLPYMMAVSRLAHHIQNYQRNKLGSTVSASTLKSDLERWIRQYVSPQENLPESMLAQKPFYAVEFSVEDIEGKPGQYHVQVNMQPRFKFEKAWFELSLVSALGDD